MKTHQPHHLGTVVTLFGDIDLGTHGVTGPPPRPKRPVVALTGKIGRLAEEWLTEYPASTASAYLADLTAFCTFCDEGGTDPLGAGRADLARFAASLSERGLATASVARTISGVSSFFSYCTATGALTSSPAVGLRRPRKSGEIRLGLSAEELALLLEAAERHGLVAWCLVALMGTAGLRVSAACGLRVGDRERDAGGPTVRAVQKGGGREPVRVSVELGTRLDELAGSRPKDAPLLTGPTGGWLARQQAGRLVRALALEARIDRPITPHELRHSFVSIALDDAGVPLPAVTKAACHRDAAVTLRYAQALALRATVPAEAVAAAVRNPQRQGRDVA
jgi:site-specific recombinase XerD